MKSGEKGSTLIELIVAITIIALVSTAASIATFQVFKGTERNNDQITAICQAQNAGFWISRDAQMARSITTDNLTSPNFLLLSWTEYDADDEEIYHTATYFFEDLTDGIGMLKRTHWSSDGANEQTLVAKYIYYNPGDPDNSSKVDYQDLLLTVQLTALVEKITETREYKITRRTNI